MCAVHHTDSFLQLQLGRAAIPAGRSFKRASLFCHSCRILKCTRAVFVSTQLLFKIPQLWLLWFKPINTPLQPPPFEQPHLPPLHHKLIASLISSVSIVHCGSAVCQLRVGAVGQASKVVTCGVSHREIQVEPRSFVRHFGSLSTTRRAP